MRKHDIPAIIVLVAMGTYAGWARMQLLLVLVLVLVLICLYRPFVQQFVRIGRGFLTRVELAKFKDLELRAENQLEALNSAQRSQVTIIDSLLLREMSPQAASLLVSIHKSGRAVFRPNSLTTLRYFRDRGLIDYDGENLRGSTEVWLTPAGDDFAMALTELTLPAPVTPD